jgi:hydroxymethylbilane synthase
MPRLVVATRRSALALAQTRAFIRALIEKNPGLEVEELQIVTSGDKIQDRPLYEAGGKGLFVKEIEEALLDGRAHFAVHSMKDLPAKQPEGLVIGCVPERADPRDVLLVRPGLTPSLDGLPKGAKVGSSSLRRRIALHAKRPDLEIAPLRGNIDTRMRKVAAGEYDGIVLAAAGLGRLGVDPATMPAHAPFAREEMLPAVAQGVLAIETRAGDVETEAVLAKMEHAPSRLRAWAERGVLEALDADCTVPLAAFAELEGDICSLSAWLTEADGSRLRAQSDKARVRTPEDARRFGFQLGAALKARGAQFTDPLEFKVACVLVEDWDPIGIQAVADAQGEYDALVPSIATMLRAGGADAKSLAKHLAGIAKDLEVEVERDDLARVAGKLLALSNG